MARILGTSDEPGFNLLLFGMEPATQQKAVRSAAQLMQLVEYADGPIDRVLWATGVVDTYDVFVFGVIAGGMVRRVAFWRRDERQRVGLSTQNTWEIELCAALDAYVKEHAHAAE